MKINNENIQETNILIQRQLSVDAFENLRVDSVTVYHIENRFIGTIQMTSMG